MRTLRAFTRVTSVGALAAALLTTTMSSAQSVSIDSSKRFQTIDGFGTCLAGAEAKQAWWQSLYFDELASSMVRMDLTPTFAAPANASFYCSPWYGNTITLPGPANNNVRTYTSAADYSNTFGGCSAPIVVMGPDIDANAAKFDFTNDQAVPGLIAQMGKAKAGALGGFKLYASMWSPAPWVKVSSGITYSGGGGSLPSNGTPFPFIWGGNFAGGRLDVSGTPLSQFNDGTANTSALTQFARGLAAFLHGFQKTYGVNFYAISIQNELNFEEFYNSMTYPLASEYVAALKAARAELDAHSDLAGIKIIGPEDLIGGDAFSLWQYGSGTTQTDKNLQYLQAVDADPVARAAIAGFNIHGYAPDGVSAAGANAQSWDWWANGWKAGPAAGIPDNVKGFTGYGKPSWMTETSGEDPAWLSPASGFPANGAFSIAIKIMQALTTGQESAWLYWQLTNGSATGAEALTDATALANSPKLVAVKHFFKFIRPGAVRVQASVTGSTSVLASAFALDSAASLTTVLVNEGAADATVSLALGTLPAGLTTFASYTSSNGKLWQTGNSAVSAGSLTITIPAYGVLTLIGAGTPPVNPDGGGGGGGGGSSDGGIASGDGGSASGGDANNANGDAANASGCGCRIENDESRSSWWAGVVAGLVLVALRRRRF